MSSKRRNTLLSLGAAFTAATLPFVLSSGHAADLGAQPLLPYDSAVANLQAAPTNVRPAVEQDSDDSEASVDPASLECMAKVVMHEAGHEPRAGKIAVAQTLVNRLKTGRFGDSICAVANQRGQFFNVTRYQPSRDSDLWASAVDVSREVLRGDADVVVPGAMFFRAASSRASAFFRTRERVAMVGAQVFYR